MFCDLDRLHAGAEAHGGVCLGHTAGHAATDAADEVRGAEGFGIVFCFGGDEEEDGTFGGGFDPSPRNEALVVYCGRLTELGRGIDGGFGGTDSLRDRLVAKFVRGHRSCHRLGWRPLLFLRLREAVYIINIGLSFRLEAHVALT